MESPMAEKTKKANAAAAPDTPVTAKIKILVVKSVDSVKMSVWTMVESSICTDTITPARMAITKAGLVSIARALILKKKIMTPAKQNRKISMVRNTGHNS